MSTPDREPDPSTDAFFETGPPSAAARLSATGWTAGPWRRDAQHGGPPGAALTRAIEALGGGERTLGRITLDLLGPVPVGSLEVRARTVRPGRSVELRAAELVDDSGRTIATAQAWLFPDASGPGDPGRPPAHGPDDGRTQPPPPSWTGGYLDAMEWRWIQGAVTEPGRGVVWMRPRIPLVAGEAMSPAQRLMLAVDSASGVSAVLDPARWAFLNTELTVHVLREVVGEWVCVDATTTIGPGSVGLAESRVYDRTGLVARSAQALLLARAR